jgi:hypothetical protein
VSDGPHDYAISILMSHAAKLRQQARAMRTPEIATERIKFATAGAQMDLMQKAEELKAAIAALEVET